MTSKDLTNPARTLAPPALALRTTRPLLLLLLSALLLSSSACRIEDNSFPEDMPSGAKPATVPKIPLSAKLAHALEREEPSTAQTEGAGAGPHAAAVPSAQHRGREGGEAGSTAHMTLTGTLPGDLDTDVWCELQPQNGFVFGFDAPGPLEIELRIADFLGSGSYPAAVVVSRSPHPGGENARHSSGTAQIAVSLATRRQGDVTTLISGRFDGSFEGEAGSGTLSGRFDRCIYQGLVNF
jgi:hypothetical protein